MSPEHTDSPHAVSAQSDGSRWHGALVAIGAVLFAIAHTQAPLYFSNQHQYFLHGLARAGMGDLASDWLANTVDPTPAFSSLVAFTATYLHPSFFHVYFFSLLVIYALSVAKIVGSCGIDLSGRRSLAFFALLALVHSGIMRWASVRITGIDYPWYVQAGVAGQYLLGPGLQPSAFGVFLLASIACFLSARPYAAVLLAGCAALTHFTYFLTAGMLTLAYTLPAMRAGRSRQALGLGAVALATVLPGLIYSVWQFAPSSTADWQAAQQILVQFRIPHHTLPNKWFNHIAGLQLAWIILSVVLAWRTRLRPVLVTLLCGSALLTAIQLIRPTNFLALLFPWRASVVLMPLATALSIGAGVRFVSARCTLPSWRAAARAVCLLLLLGLGAGGIWIMATQQAYHASADERPLLNHVRVFRKPGDVYLLPIKPPKLLEAPRRSISASFTPPPRSAQDPHLVAVDLQRFRIYTGAAIFVDFKSIPYKDVEVLAWRQRLAAVEHWYAQNDWDEPRIRRELKQHGITHVVVAGAYEPRGTKLTLEFGNDAYRLYRLAETQD